MIMTPRRSRIFSLCLKTVFGIALFLILGTGQAYAQCLAGVPCIIPYTPNLPLVRGDGPTAPGSPNQPKATDGGVCLPGVTPAEGCTCDADFMNQIYARAWLESQRDMIKAEVLIRKPDSILEYTCFNQFNDLAVTRAAPLFSETERWTGGGIFGSNGFTDTRSFALVGPPRDQIGRIVKPLLLLASSAGAVGSGYVHNESLHRFKVRLEFDLRLRSVTELLDKLVSAVSDKQKAQQVVQQGLQDMLQQFTGPNGFIGLTGPPNVANMASGIVCMPHSVPITSNWLIGWINWFPIPCVGINVYMGPDKMENSLEGLVKASLRNYIDQNFSHRFLGGAATSLDYVEISGAGGYNCDFMDQVYFLSKCTDIVTDDRFWKFSELINVDPRVLPEMCTGGTKITQDMIDLSENKDLEYVFFDRIFSNNWLLAHDGGAVGCTPPIPTGLITVLKTYDVDSRGNVSVTSTEEILDKFCVAPNCHYEGGATCVAP